MTAADLNAIHSPTPGNTTQQSASAVVVGLILAKVCLHLALVNRYGIHGDELYFIECGRHLAFGYVDHPPMIPWLAALAGIFDHALLALRLPAIIAGAGTMALVAWMVREWGGGRTAQLLAGLATLLAPAFLRMGSMLDIPVIEVFLWTAASALVLYTLKTGQQRLWLAIGVVAGIGLLTKHSFLLWGVGLAVGMLLTPARRHLATPWPYIGGGLALLIFSPNLWWQITHDWATAEFLSGMRQGVLADIPVSLFLAGQVLYMQPFALPIWLTGLVSLLRRNDDRTVFAWMYLTALATLMYTGGKPYYAAPSYPLLFAAGGVALERVLAPPHRAALRRRGIATLAITGGLLALLVLPLLPLRWVDTGVEALLGTIVPPMALTHDLHAQYGWREHAEVVTRVYTALPPAERAQAVILTRSYSQAAAINFYATELNLPPAHSGHLTYYLWGPPTQRGDVTIAYGLAPEWLRQHFHSVEEVDRIVAPLARPFDTDLPVFICRNPHQPLAVLWPQLRRYFNGGTHPTTPRYELGL